MSVINIKNAHIAFITEDEEDNIVYETPEPIPYLMKVDVNPVFAEGKNYGDGVISQNITKLQGANLAAEWNRIPLKIQAKIYGRTVVNGEMETSTEDKPKRFAFGYEEDLGDGNSEFCWYYDCVATPFSKSNQQSTDNITFGSNTLTINAKSRKKDGKIARIADTLDPEFKGRETWFQSVERAPVP